MAHETAKRPLAFRMRPRTLERLKRRAAELGQPQAVLAERYIDEGVRVDDHPLIYFRSGPGGRRAAIVGTRLDVWQVMDVIRSHGNSLEAATEYLELPEPKLRAAVRYYADYQDEIDAWAARARTVAEREEGLWRREQSLLD